MGTVWILTDQRYLAQRMPAALVDELHVHDVPVRLVVVDEVTLSSVNGTVRSPLDELDGGDVVVARSRHPFALTLLELAERSGVQVLTPWAAVALVRDKARCVDVLSAGEVPVPGTILAADTGALAHLEPDWFPLLLKPHLGNNGEGLVRVESPDQLAGLDWDDGLVLAQRWVEAGGWDLKLYLCGGHAWAVRRRSPIADAEGDGEPPASPLEMTAELRDLADRCRQLFGMPLCGIDVLHCTSGLRVVDVNDFPNYTGVPEAPAVMAELVLDALERAEVGDIALVGTAAREVAS